MTDDVVAELESWAEGIRRTVGPSVDADILQCACAEIVALRRYKHENHEAMEIIQKAAELISTQEVGAVSEAKRLIRDEALEEAAHECDEEAKGSSEGFRDGCETCSAAIRALKDKPSLGG